MVKYIINSSFAFKLFRIFTDKKLSERMNDIIISN